MNISNYNKAEVLAALYNNAIVMGLGFLHADVSEMSVKEAEYLLDKSTNKYFDYVKGRVMKVNLAKDELDTRMYNRDNGKGAAERIIEKLQRI